LCTPLGSEIDLQSFHPYPLSRKKDFIRVNSLAKLDASDALDGKKFYHDEKTGYV